MCRGVGEVRENTAGGGNQIRLCEDQAKDLKFILRALGSYCRAQSSGVCKAADRRLSLGCVGAFQSAEWAVVKQAVPVP